MDFALRHVATAMPGRAAWIRGSAYMSIPPLGHAAVRDDGHVYFYRVKKGERRAFRAWAATTFQHGLSTTRIVGMWPSYESVTI